MSVTPSGAKVEASKATRWKGVLRIVVALALLAVVFGFVKWRDTLTWPSRFGEQPLIGRFFLASESGGDHARFVVEEGERTGLELEFIAARTGWTTVVEHAPGGAPARIELTAEQQKELEQQPASGLKTALGRLARSPLALIEALLLYLVGGMISFQRWQVLLRAVHVDARFWRVQKLGFIGLFFSNIIPGMTGGDLVKAIMVARDHPEQRPAAVLSVIVDRAIGLLGLALVASGALLFQRGRFEGMEKKLNLLLLAILVGATVVLSKRLRRLVRLDKLLAALPFAELLKKLDRSAQLYRAARWQLVYAVLVSLVVHFMILTAFAVLGRALGLHIRFLDYYALAPLGLIAQSLPLTPGGVGLGEAAFIFFFAKAGVKAAAAFALSISYRLVQLVISLIGGVVMLTKHEPPVSRREMDDSQN